MSSAAPIAPLLATSTPSGAPRFIHALAIGLCGLAIRAYFIWRYPAVFGGDTVLRLANWEHILLSYQLPLPQALVHILHGLAPGPTLVRCAMAIVGALAGVSFYVFACMMVQPGVALLGALFFVANPMILTHSTVPYQEIFLLGGVLGAFYGALTPRWCLAAACLGIACLARYESWIACPLIALSYVTRKGWSFRSVIEATLLFGCVPLVWIAYNRGITPAGGFAVEGSFHLERFWRWIYVAYSAVRNTPPPVLLLALFGSWQAWRLRLWRQPPYLLLSGYVVLFLIALLFSAHGVSPDRERYVTAREAHVPLAWIAILATVGLPFIPRYQPLIVALCVATGLWMSDRFLRGATQSPQLALSFAAARFLDSHVQSGERAVVLCAPIPSDDSYLATLERMRGPAGRAAGIVILNTLDTRPPGYFQILVNSHLPKSRLDNYSGLIFTSGSRSDTIVKRHVPERLPNWVVAWSDFRPTSAGEQRIAAVAAATPATVFLRQGPLSLAVYHMR